MLSGKSLLLLIQALKIDQSEFPLERAILNLEEKGLGSKGDLWDVFRSLRFLDKNVFVGSGLKAVMQLLHSL